MKHVFRSVLSLLLAATLLLGGVSLAEEQPKSVNVAVTSTITTMNPLLIGPEEVVKYALSLTFLPLVELNKELEFVPQLADSITTEDNLTFTIHLDEKATWSDGVPVTAKDVEFVFLCMTNPACGNTGMSMYAIEGVGDDGFIAADATSIDGVKIIDDKTLTVTAKWPMALYTFMNNFGRYVLPLPEHVLGSVPKDQLLTYDWFNKPTVVSGPYCIVDFDLNHYVHYEANKAYWQGEPKIKYLNLNVVESAQLLAGLQSGEIDLIQQTMGSILLEDYEAVKALDNVTVHMGTPVTNQSIFVNVNRVPDVRIRQALLYGIDRELILRELVYGNGEIVDGFLCSASPYYSDEVVPTAYDPEKAAKLIAEAKADGTLTTLTWYVNSGDVTFVQAASFIAAMFQEIGLTIDIKTVDFATLMSVANNLEFDVMSVQYTYAPVDPYTDVSWLLSEWGWTQYVNDEVTAALNESQALTDVEQITARYTYVDQMMQQDAPMISAYILSTMGVCSNRLVNATPDVFGTFINVHEWDVQ